MKKEDINKKQYQAKDYEWPILQSEPELEIPTNVFWWTMPNCYLQGLWAYEPLSEILKYACLGLGLGLGLGVVLNGIRCLTFPIICMQDCCKCRYNYL